MQGSATSVRQLPLFLGTQCVFLCRYQVICHLTSFLCTYTCNCYPFPRLNHLSTLMFDGYHDLFIHLLCGTRSLADLLPWQYKGLTLQPLGHFSTQMSCLDGLPNCVCIYMYRSKGSFWLKYKKFQWQLYAYVMYMYYYSPIILYPCVVATLYNHRILKCSLVGVQEIWTTVL